ncbi:MAG: orotate phosphoribosyltransferase [Thermodesulfobacteriota bacterium]
MYREEGWERLRQLLRERSYEKRRVVLTSGRESDFYVDGKQTSLHPEGAYLIGKLMFLQLKSKEPMVQAVGGMTLGADPLVSSVALVSHLEGTPLPAFIIRKEPKGHGTGQWIEGKKNIPPRAPVAILEDVVTTGGTTLKAIERAEQEGLKVVRVLALVDREEGGAEAIRGAGFTLEALFRRSDLERT